MTSTCRPTIFLMVLAITSATDVAAAESESLCDGLKKALATADAKFVPLRGGFDFSLNEYKANVSFGSATECSTDSSDGVSELQCTQNFDGLQDAQTTFASNMRTIQQCFGRGVTLKRSNLPYHKWFRHEETTNDIEIRLGELKGRGGRPPRPYIQITVNYIDPTVR